MPTIEYYDAVLSRSLLIWINIYYELKNQHKADPDHCDKMSSLLNEMRLALKARCDTETFPEPTPDVIQKLKDRLNGYHKTVVHSMKDREPLHAMLRGYEQAFRDLEAFVKLMEDTCSTGVKKS